MSHVSHNKMVRHRGGNTSMDHVCNEIMGLTITSNCFPKDPGRARRELIEQYNRKPSVYVESSVKQQCLNVLQGASNFLSGVFRRANASAGDDSSRNTDRKPEKRRILSGVPRCEACDVIDASIFKAIQHTICYAGAGLGIIGVGVVTLFGLCAAAGAACTVTMCNKFADKNCNIEAYDPEETELQYGGKPVLNVQNSYTPVSTMRATPTNNSPLYYTRY